MRFIKAMVLLAAVVVGVQFTHVAHGSASILLCNQQASLPIADEYAIKNDNFMGVPQCLSAPSDETPSFQVVVSKANSRGVEPLAYPEIFVGCTWGLCSPDSPLPAPLDTLPDPRTSWDTSQRASGTWNAAYDLWFDQYPMRNGQATGAEMMIWLNEQDTASSAGWPIVTLDNTRWYLVTWVTSGHGKHWRYISFRKVDPTLQVRHLALEPFFKLAESKGWIRPDWYLLNVEAGFEIWSGGCGLTTRSFSTTV
ncbi:MAG: hypothetical protein ABSA93_26420 [Streptosporangiaceae bacterium]|jgi:glycosyl hydrolase family 12